MSKRDLRNVSLPALGDLIAICGQTRDRHSLDQIDQVLLVLQRRLERLTEVKRELDCVSIEGFADL